MRLDYDSILQQTFKDSFRGYNKDEVQTFLKLVANDFKEMKRDIARLKEETKSKSLRIKTLEDELANREARQASNLESMRAALKDKARKFVDQARDQADRHKRKVESEVHHLQEDIRKLREEKEHLLENFKAAAQSYLDERKK